MCNMFHLIIRFNVSPILFLFYVTLATSLRNFADVLITINWWLTNVINLIYV